MRILLDHSTPAPLRHYLKNHLVTEAVERGWDELDNGVDIPLPPKEPFTRSW
jgi:hypothetical protein